MSYCLTKEKEKYESLFNYPEKLKMYFLIKPLFSSTCKMDKVCLFVVYQIENFQDRNKYLICIYYAYFAIHEPNNTSYNPWKFKRKKIAETR